MRLGKIGICIFLFAVLTSVVLAAVGCGKAKAKPEIASLDPDSGSPGTEVVIRGGSFGTAQGLGVVHFGTEIAEVVAWSDTSITVKVPEGLEVAEYGVTVETEMGVSNEVGFTVKGKEKEKASIKIISLEPESGAPGSEVEIRGSGFGSTQGKGKVLFGKGQAEVIDWSETTIIIKVPDNATPNTYGVTVETDEGKSNEAVFKVEDQNELQSQKEAVISYLKSQGQSTAGSEQWTIRLVKRSAQDPNWEVVEITKQDKKTFKAMMIFNNMLGGWECLSIAGPPWTGVEFKGAEVPSDLKNV
jgi:hypothetical protein